MKLLLSQVTVDNQQEGAAILGEALGMTGLDLRVSVQCLGLDLVRRVSRGGSLGSQCARPLSCIRQREPSGLQARPPGRRALPRRAGESGSEARLAPSFA